MAMSSMNEENLVVTTSYSLFWFDPNSNNTQNLFKDLNNIVNTNELKIFENLEECEEMIRMSMEKILVLIVSDCLGMELVSRVHGLKQVSIIYVYSSTGRFHFQWTKNYRKIKNVINDMANLIQQIQTDYRYRQPLGTIDFFTNDEQSQQKSCKNLKSENVTFVWQQLFIEVLLRLDLKESCNNDELIDYLTEIYANNPSQRAFIEEFRQTYQPTQSIQWYTRPGCLFSQLNEALRKTDLQTVIRYRFFIKNLYKQLKYEHEHQRKTTSSEIYHVYRGQLMSPDELKQLQTTIGQYVSFNSFLSTSRDRRVGEAFAGNDSKTSLLLDIKIDPNMATLTKPFASISNLSYTGKDEEEILFMLGTIFRVILVIKPEKPDDIWIFQLQLVNEDEHYLKEFCHCRKEELPIKTSLIDLQPLLLEMNGSTNNLSKTTDAVGQKQTKSNLWINLLHGVIHIIKIPFGNDSTMLTKPCTSLGLAYYNSGDYKSAIDCFEKCLSIRNTNRCADNDVFICDTLVHLGLVYKAMGNFDRALDYVSESIFLRERTLISLDQHLILVENYMVMSDLYAALHKYNLALEFAEGKALPIYLSIHSKTKTDQLKLARVYRSIGIIYEEMTNYDAALDNYKQSFKFYENIYPFDRINDVFHHHNSEMQDISKRLLKTIDITKRTNELSLIDDYYSEFNDERDEAQRMFANNFLSRTY